MDIPGVGRRRLHYRHAKSRQLLVVSLSIVVLVGLRCFALTSLKTFSLLHADSTSITPRVEISVLAITPKHLSTANATFASNSHEKGSDEDETDMDYRLESGDERNATNGGLAFGKSEILGKSLEMESHQGAIYSFAQERPKFSHDTVERANDIRFASEGISSKGIKIVDADLSTSGLSSFGSGMPYMLPKNDETEQLKSTSTVLNDDSNMGNLSTKKKLLQPMSITQMNSLLIQSFNSSPPTRSRWASPRDRELLSAKLQIESAPVISNGSGLYASVFRDISKFTRSYELMERKLKVYIYREGEKPMFHQPKMRGIYASEGWFMKLMETNKRFIARDPRKAHLFYLPFSSLKLRENLSGQNVGKQIEHYLERYVELIAGKYRYWNRTGGADHFLVACHDWASQITRQLMKSCIRALCNANVARGFKLGKDTTLPVTYVHSMQDPAKVVEAKLPSERPILAFFAGGMHGYVRPILVKYWENKDADMKIFGPLPRDAEGKRIYKEYMQSSKYCICARGYEVHTPRIVEAILSECVPVILSDNYVPPFFEVLEWEAFSVFVEERHIPNLRSILISIPEEKYQELQLGVKKVQQHFMWHKVPVKYDLFHMILHSVWYNRLSQIRSR